ncbi:unnamed protein product [Sphenostylis stenocarpa]|uniref:Uncharacterized protein n=1 Tax=Sphenostylis stenocarpa TaxID=92480 RepID=A0AA86S2A2_9FABA|nr:unnamed protein product [Sphenostylis stenocarpa]
MAENTGSMSSKMLGSSPSGSGIRANEPHLHGCLSFEEAVHDTRIVEGWRDRYARING